MADEGKLTTSEYDPRMRHVEGRDIAALANPRALAVVGASYGGGTDFATIAWFTPISHSPAMLAFSLRRASHSYRLLEQSRWCSLSIPDTSMADLVAYCGNNTGRTVDKAAKVPHVMLPLPAAASDASLTTNTGSIPVIEGALSHIICEIESIREAGDHQLVCAYVREAHTRCDEDDKGRVISTDALLCLQHDVFAHADLP